MGYVKYISKISHFYCHFRKGSKWYHFKTPWKGDPRINLQKVDKMAKFYQVKDVKKAIEKMEAKKNEE
jgi:hypothetical protein